jgi:YD repeat-containing protein
VLAIPSTTVLGTLTYTYDAEGNRTRVGGTWAPVAPLPAATSPATYDLANQQLSFNTQSFTYDANGRLTSDGVNLYMWNARNQLIAIDGPGLTASFSYDGLGRRQGKVVNGASTEFLYDGLNPVPELVGSGIAANLFTGFPLDEYFTRTDAAGPRFFLADALGSTVALVDGAGVVQTRYSYDPFGAVTITGAFGGNPFQFTGREKDGTGLYYYRTRYYRPHT